MNKIIISSIIVVSIITGIVYLTSEDDGSKIIKLGFVGPLTGDVASLGVAAQKSVELAVKEINDQGGINSKKIEVVYEDGKCVSVSASNAANKLINADKVIAIIGGACSTETSAFAPGAMQNKIIVFSYCSSAPNLSKTGKYFFRDYPSDSLQGKFAADYIVNVLRKKKVAIVYHVSDWGNGLQEVFAKRVNELGGEILLSEGVSQNEKDYRSVLSRVKNLNPDMVYAPMYSVGGAAFVTQYAQMGLGIQVMGGDAWDDTNFRKQASKVMNGKIIYSVAASVPDKEFEDKFNAYAPGYGSTICSPQSYDAVNILAQTIKKVGTDPDKIADELHSLKDYNGVSGRISFDQNGDVTDANYVVKIIKDGRAEEYKNQ